MHANNDPYRGGGSLYSDAATSAFTITTTGAIDPAPLPPASAMALVAMGPLSVANRRQRWHTIT
jgi:hypothetical protein